MASPAPDPSTRSTSRRENPSSSANPGDTPIPDEDHGADLPLTMSASVVLSSLPRDAHKALADVEAVDVGKGESNFVPHLNPSYYSYYLASSIYILPYLSDPLTCLIQ